MLVYDHHQPCCREFSRSRFTVPSEIQKVSMHVLDSQVKGIRMRHTVDPRNALLQVFSSISNNETLIDLSDGVGQTASLFNSLLRSPHNIGYGSNLRKDDC